MQKLGSYLLREYFPRSILILGSSAFLAGASVPIFITFKEVFSSANTVSSALITLADSPWVEAFPVIVSNEKICKDVSRTKSLSSLLQNTKVVDPLFHKDQLSQIAPILNLSLSTSLNIANWPTIHPQAKFARVPILMYHDITEDPQVFFDLTPETFESHLKLIIDSGLTPVSLDQVVQHLRTGLPLPTKPILLTFDDGYLGHYKYVYPLLKKYNFPAVFSVFPAKLDGAIAGRSTLSWGQLKEMSQNPLITIAAHSVTHPEDLTQVDDESLTHEVSDSKEQLEATLNMPIHYFTYPAGHYDARVTQAVSDAGYIAALTMRQHNEQFAGNSESLLAIERFGQSNLNQLLTLAWGDLSTSSITEPEFDFVAPIKLSEITLEDIPLALISGGKPVTIHADSRYQLSDIVQDTNAEAAVDGGFFSLKYLDSNVMIGPVLSQSTRQFIPGNISENPRLNGRPLVLISPNAVEFLAFDAAHHNTLTGLQSQMKDVTDAFVAAAWLVKAGKPQTAEDFGTLFDFDAKRHRAFWGINYIGQPVIGVSHHVVDSVTLGRLLAQAGLYEAVMLDSGASTSLTYKGESLVGYTPRPVPHAVALIPPNQIGGSPCSLVVHRNSPNLP